MGGPDPEPPADVTGWRDWTGQLISERPGEDAGAVGAPEQPVHHDAGQRAQHRAGLRDPKGVPIDAIIFGGRTRDREPLIRAITDLAEGVYDGLTLGAEATFAAEGVDGPLRYDPMSMRPFMSYPEGAYAAHWLKIIGAAASQPIFAHVNWFQRDPEDGHFLWPGYRENLRPLLWLLRLRDGEVQGGRRRSASSRTRTSLTSTGSTIAPQDLDTILSIDTPRWKQEMAYREEHLAQFDGLPEEIWQAHRRVAAALDEAS